MESLYTSKHRIYRGGSNVLYWVLGEGDGHLYLAVVIDGKEVPMLILPDRGVPYLCGYADEEHKSLFRRFGVPVRTGISAVWLSLNVVGLL